MASYGRRGKKGGEENALTTRAAAVEDTIRLQVEELIQAIEQQISSQDELGLCETEYPMNTKAADGMPPREYQSAVVVWANVVQYFEEKQTFRIGIVATDQGEKIRLSWQQAIAPEIVVASEQILARYRKQKS
jgi:hypothetical protein